MPVHQGTGSNEVATANAELGQEANATSTGLGLAIEKRILGLHGSQIGVTSRLSEGARFQFDLPEARLAA